MKASKQAWKSEAPHIRKYCRIQVSSLKNALKTTKSCPARQSHALPDDRSMTFLFQKIPSGIFTLFPASVSNHRHVCLIPPPPRPTTPSASPSGAGAKSSSTPSETATCRKRKQARIHPMSPSTAKATKTTDNESMGTFQSDSLSSGQKTICTRNI